MRQAAGGPPPGLRRVSSRVSTALLASVLAFGAGSLTADGGSLVDEVVEMLEAGLSGEIVLEWLETHGRSLQALSADEMIALREAGATDALLATRTMRRLGRAVARAEGPLARQPHRGDGGVRLSAGAQGHLSR